MPHTPGPWRVGFDRKPYGIFVGPVGTDTTSRSAQPIGVVFRSQVRGPADEQEANARLIAAAPTLLEALERLLEEACSRFDGIETTLEEDGAVEAAEAALKLAREGV